MRTEDIAFGLIIGFIVLLFLSVAGFGIMSSVRAGHKGVVSVYGKVQPIPLNPGFVWKFPWTMVTQMSVQTKSVRMIHMTAASKDIQDVYVNTSVNYRLDSEHVVELYKTIGKEKVIENTIIKPAILQILKANTVAYTAETTFENREVLRVDIEDGLKERLSPFGIIVDYVNLEDIDFDPDYKREIEKKAQASQRLETSRRELEITKVVAQQKIEENKGIAEANLILARSQAEAFDLMKRSISPELVQYEAIQKWNGQPPKVSGVGSIIPFVSMETDTLSGYQLEN